MARPKGKQINQLVGKAYWNTTGVAIPAATTVSVTSLLTGLTPAGSDSALGIYTTSPQNKVFLRESGTGKALRDEAHGSSVFARLTEAADAWTLAFFSLVAGVETPFDFTGHALQGQNFDFRYCESVQFGNLPPTAIVNVGEGIDEISSASALTHQHVVDHPTIATNGQTAITLSQTPKDANDVVLIVNGIQYALTTDYTISGTTLTWLDTDFTLETTDKVSVEYAY